MRNEAYDLLASRQDRYWWHRARRLMVRQLLRRSGMLPRPRWLDLGCGPGANLPLLESFNPDLAVGIDLSPVALNLARENMSSVQLVRADISQSLPFADSTFSLVSVFNVLYHDWISDEAAILAEVRRVLRPGGLLLATEPAFPILARSMDAAVMTRKRYRASEFGHLCASADFKVLYVSYFTSFGMLIILLLKGGKWVRKIFHCGKAIGEVAIDMQPLSRFSNKFLFGIAAVEAWLVAHGLPMPFGTTLVCLARK